MQEECNNRKCKLGVLTRKELKGTCQTTPIHIMAVGYGCRFLVAEESWNDMFSDDLQRYPTSGGKSSSVLYSAQANHQRRKCCITDISWCPSCKFLLYPTKMKCDQVI